MGSPSSDFLTVSGPGLGTSAEIFMVKTRTAYKNLEPGEGEEYLGK